VDNVDPKGLLDDRIGWEGKRGKSFRGESTGGAVMVFKEAEKGKFCWSNEVGQQKVSTAKRQVECQ